MKFTEENLALVLAVNKVPPATIRTWKHRDQIPKKYLAPLPEKVRAYEPFQEMLKDPLLHAGKLGVSTSTLRSAIQYGSPIPVSDYRKINKSLKTLSQDLRKRSGTETGFFALAVDERINVDSFFSDPQSRRMLWRFRKSGKKMSFRDGEIQHIATLVEALIRKVETYVR